MGIEKERADSTGTVRKHIRQGHGNEREREEAGERRERCVRDLDAVDFHWPRQMPYCFAVFQNFDFSRYVYHMSESRIL